MLNMIHMLITISGGGEGFWNRPFLMMVISKIFTDPNFTKLDKMMRPLIRIHMKCL